MSDNTFGCLLCLSVFLIICCLTNIILTSIQLAKQKNYVYDALLSILDNNPLLLEINQKKCADYIADIKNKKIISKAKTIIILFSVYLMVGTIVELVIVSLSLSYYNQTDYDSDNFEKCNKFNGTLLISEEIFEEAIESQWVIKIDKGLLSIVCIYFFPIFIYSILILCNLCDDSNKLNCIDQSFVFNCFCI